jgi:hypothetical protein
MHGPTYIFWANLTPFSLQAKAAAAAEARIAIDQAAHAKEQAAEAVAIGLGRIVALTYLLILFIPESRTHSVPLF